MRFDRIVNLFLFGILIVMIAGSANFQIKKNSDVYFNIDDHGNIKIGKGFNSLYVKNNGNVGIGKTSPGAKLDVNGKIKANSAEFTNNINAKDATFSGDVRVNGKLDASNIKNLIHVKNNNVGIGTNDPKAKLHVNGMVKVKCIQIGNKIIIDQTQESYLKCSGCITVDNVGWGDAGIKVCTSCEECS